MKRRFIGWEPRQDTQAKVVQCGEIVQEYLDQGLKLTLRQLYYQHVARALIPNTERSYKNLGTLVSKARLAGLLDWDAIEDRGREPDTQNDWDNVWDLVDSAVRWFRLPRWEGQGCRAELWVEKEALAGVLEPIARKHHVTLMVNKGYSSQSAMFESALRLMRLDRECDGGVRVYYLGDLDPSGEDMVRDIRDRLDMFTRSSIDLEVVKLALTTEQVEEYGPPPNPTKVTDSRARGYIEKYGHECWEVDALDPRTLTRIITDVFDEIIDHEMMDEVIEREDDGKRRLREAAREIDEDE